MTGRRTWLAASLASYALVAGLALAMGTGWLHVHGSDPLPTWYRVIGYTQGGLGVISGVGAFRGGRWAWWVMLSFLILQLARALAMGPDLWRTWQGPTLELADRLMALVMALVGSGLPVAALVLLWNVRLREAVRGGEDHEPYGGGG